MSPAVDNSGIKYYMWNYPNQYESGVCWIVKPSKRTRKLAKAETRTKNPITSKM